MTTLDSQALVTKVGDFIEKFSEWHNDAYNKSPDKIIFDFQEMSELDPELAVNLLDDPEQTLTAFRNVINKEPRFKNINKSQVKSLSHVREKHLDKFIGVEGVIRFAGKAMLLTESIVFTCNGCGEEHTKLQLGENVKKLTYCYKCAGKKLYIKKYNKTNLQRLLLEEPLENVSGNNPASIHAMLKKDLLDPKLNKIVIPGNRVILWGILKTNDDENKKLESEYLFDTNYIEVVEEIEAEVNLSKEDIEKIHKEAKKKNFLKKMLAGFAPHIYGMTHIKKALILQALSGKKVVKSGKIDANLMHILLMGDPGCCVKNTYLSTTNGSFKKVQTFGTKHLQEIKTGVMIDRIKSTNSSSATATTFHQYPNQPTKKITLKTGKQLKCNYKHPLFVKNKGWTRADELKVGGAVKIQRVISCTKKKLEAFKTRYKGKKVYCDEEIAWLYGILIADGNQRNNSGYEINLGLKKECLIPKINKIIKNEFNFKTHIRKEHKLLTSSINNRTEKYINRVTINSVKLFPLLFDGMTPYNKEVPEIIMASKKSVVASFLKGLFTTDGTIFIGERIDRTNKVRISLTAKNDELLRQVQLLLLKFGIEAKINQKNQDYNDLRINKQKDCLKFLEEIGFSENKKVIATKALKHLKKTIPNMKHFKTSLYEPIVSIEEGEVQTVYDVTVPKAHRYISNGIISHNTAKTEVAKSIKQIVPKYRYANGTAATPVGLLASAEKDEFFGGWVVKAGAIVMAHGGILNIDEFDKMGDDTQKSLNEALSEYTISKDAGGVHAVLKCETKVLAVANPKHGRFDPNLDVVSQINLDESLLSRFDLIYVVKDVPSDDDLKIANKMMDSMFGESELESDNNDNGSTIYTPEFMRKFVSFAKNLDVKTQTKQAREFISKKFAELRKQTTNNNRVSITNRQFNAMLKLAISFARLRLSDKVELKDAEQAFQTVIESLEGVALDPQTGQLDIDSIMLGRFKSDSDTGMRLKEIFEEHKEMTFDDIKENLGVEISDAKLEQLLNKMKMEGLLFSPKRDLWHRI